MQPQRVISRESGPAQVGARPSLIPLWALIGIGYFVHPFGALKELLFIAIPVVLRRALGDSALKDALVGSGDGL